MSLDRQVEAVLAMVRAANTREYWQMTPAEARDWHNAKGARLDIAPQPVHRVAEFSIDGPRQTPKQER